MAGTAMRLPHQFRKADIRLEGAVAEARMTEAAEATEAGLTTLMAA